MKTTKDQRAEMRRFAALKAVHSNDAFSPRDALSLIDDVEEATRLLNSACQDKHQAATILHDAERQIASGGKGQQTSTLQEKVIRARMLLERTAPYTAFLKEPSE